jgi:ABC-2 type transport system ATP-binding protein
VVAADSGGAFEVESERGTDIRRDLAKTIVTRGWGLLELRPMRMSLEEIFLQVTTDETAAADAARAEAAENSTEEAPRE